MFGSFVSELSVKRSYLYCNRTPSYRSLVLTSSNRVHIDSYNVLAHLCVALVGMWCGRIPTKGNYYPCWNVIMFDVSKNTITI